MSWIRVFYAPSVLEKPDTTDTEDVFCIQCRIGNRNCHNVFTILHIYTLTALFDAVLCSENNLKDVQSLLKEMYRVLKTGGVYLMISHGAPDNRVNHIKRYIDVDIDVIPIRKCSVWMLLLLRCLFLTASALRAWLSLPVHDLLFTPCVVLLLAKPDLKGVDESDEACYHYMYVLAKNSS